MAFLSGVLSNIKEHLGQHKDAIQPAIDILREKKHAGKKGFNVAIEKVVAGVRGYNDGVRNSNNHVKSKITDFDREMKRLKETVSGIVQNNRVADEALKYEQVAEEFERRLAEYQDRAEKFNKTLDMQHNDLTTRNAINGLNDKLRDRIDNVHKTMVHEKSKLTDLAAKEKERFQSMEECINTTLVGVGTCVNREIGNKVNALICGLRERVRKMFEQLEKINKDLPQHVDKLQEWINDADKEIGATQGHLKKITEQTDNSITSLKYPIEDAVTELRKRKDELDAYIRGERSGLTEFVNKVYEAIRVLGKLFGTTVGQNGKMDEIFTDIASKVTTINNGILGNVPGTGIDHNWGDVKTNVAELVDGLTNTEKKNSKPVGRLQHIVTGVATWAEKFKKDYGTTLESGFGNILKQWLEDILTENHVVKSRLSMYVGDNKEKVTDKFQGKLIDNGSDEFNKLTIGSIASQIRDELKTSIIASVTLGSHKQIVGADTPESIRKNTEYVIEVCTKFAETLADKFKQKEINAIAEKITKSVEGIFGIGADISGYYNSHLQNAIERILEQLVDVAKNVASELKKFTETSLVSNINEAIVDVGKISKVLSAASHHIDFSLQGMKKTLPQLNSSFDSATSDASSPSKAVDTAIKTVKTGVESINVDHITSALERLSREITTNLKSLTTTISDAAYAANVKLTDLRNKKIGKTPNKGELQKLQHSFNDLKEPVTVALKTAKSFLGSVDHTGTATIQALGKDVDSQVESAKRTLITQAKKQYVSSLQGLLVAFSTKAEQELEPLPKEITDDLDIGYKGFMNKFEKSFITGDKSIKSIKDIETASPQKESPLRQAAGKFNLAFRRFIRELEAQADFKSDFGRIKPSYDALTNLLTALAKSEHFDHTFKENMDAFRNVVSEFKPATYGEAKCPLLLNALKKGLTNLVSELDKAYVSVYDSETFGANLVEKEKLTPYGTQLFKVFMSIFEMMHEDLSYLKNQCISKWHNSRIYSGSSMGTFLNNCGYTVSNHDSHQNGELRNKAECDGKHIYSTLVGGFSHVYNTRENTKNAFQNLYDYLPTYYRVCQLPTFSSIRRPCSIYEMLRWLSGLPYNAVYLDLMSDDFADLFDKPKAAKTESISIDGISLEDQTPNTLNAYPQKVKRSDLHDAITHITSLAPTVLTTVVGYGDAYSTYAVDYYCNAPSFVYPSSAADCLTMLIELLRRLLPVFRFLHSRCSNMASEYGWYQCRYGTTIDSSNWHCSDHSKTKVDCQPTSPLMSYLKDCLPGHLPHHVTNVDCKSSCSTCPKNLPGQPCLTPLGFRGFSGSTKTGKDICNVLTRFFANAHLTTLLCVIPKPPSTLPEHFEFTLSLTKGWNSKIVPLPLTWVQECIKEQSIALYNDTAQLTNALGNAYNSNHGGNTERHPAAERADLSSLSMTKSCLYSNADNIQCSPYLYALCSDSYHLLAKKHCNLYLSWAVYLPWTFYGYLQALCQSFGNISCQDWGCSGCGNGTKCKKGKHGIDNCKCKGILECRGVLSTFYSYGFTYGNAEILLNKEGKRYCHNFYQQLKNLLNSKCFTDLFDKCDEFIFTIREPFIWLNVALWSLSLFYLLCVMVGRLDVLHIKSHLRIPSSHKITAQSLLAAAQVGRLAKISYLQP